MSKNEKSPIDAGLVAFEHEEDGRVRNVVFLPNPDSDRIGYIGSRKEEDRFNTEPAVKAYAEALIHKDWNHPLTDQEYGTVIVRTTVTNEDFFRSGVGFAFVDHEEPKIPPVTLEEYPHGVASLNIRNGRFYLSDIEDAEEKAYAEWLQAAFFGRNMRIRVLYKGNGSYGKTLEENFSLPTFEERIEYRDKKSQNRTEQNQIRRHVGRTLAKANGAPVGGDGPIMIKLFGTNKEVDLLELPPQRITTYSNRGNIDRRSWNGTDGDKIAFQRMVALDWQFELESNAS